MPLMSRALSWSLSFVSVAALAAAVAQAFVIPDHRYLLWFTVACVAVFFGLGPSRWYRFGHKVTLGFVGVGACALGLAIYTVVASPAFLAGAMRY